MIDTSNFNLDTPVKINISEPGLYLPELETFTPARSYASIEQVITMLNRGINVKFPDQEKNEIGEKIEEILLIYKERQASLKKKYGDIGSNVENAINTIQELNDSKISMEEKQQEIEEQIFEYDDVVKHIVTSFNNPSSMDFTNPDIYATGEDRIEREKERRKSRERIAAKRKAALEMAKLETETYKKLTQQGNFNFNDPAMQLDYDDTTVFLRKNSKDKK